MQLKMLRNQRKERKKETKKEDNEDEYGFLDSSEVTAESSVAKGADVGKGDKDNEYGFLEAAQVEAESDGEGKKKDKNKKKKEADKGKKKKKADEPAEKKKDEKDDEYGFLEAAQVEAESDGEGKKKDKKEKKEKEKEKADKPAGGKEGEDLYGYLEKEDVAGEGGDKDDGDKDPSSSPDENTGLADSTPKKKKWQIWKNK